MEPKRYHLETLVGMALSMPREGEKLLKWKEVKLVGGRRTSGFQTKICFELVGQKLLILSVSM